MTPIMSPKIRVDFELCKEYLDATIYLDMIWKDRRLEWNREEFGGIHRIRVAHEQVWIPDLEVMNRIHDFALTEEKLPRVSINNHGRVWLKRYFRMRVRFHPEIENYPYDQQMPEIIIASADKDEDIQSRVT